MHILELALSGGLSTDTGKTFEPSLCDVIFQHSPGLDKKFVFIRSNGVDEGPTLSSGAGLRASLNSKNFNQ
jgi:hypothetical protein